MKGKMEMKTITNGLNKAAAITNLLMVYFENIDQPLADLDEDTITTSLCEILSSIEDANSFIKTQNHS